MNGRDRWFRQDEWPIWTFDAGSVEFRRLEWAAGLAGLPIMLLAVAAQIIADRNGIELREAWDRLAFNLERMQDGRWPSPRVETLRPMDTRHPMEIGS
jgi:hypothetical protein